MLELIKDIEKLLLSNNLRCALGMALTLPDICGQIEYPAEDSVGKRYKDWCRGYLFNQGFHSYVPFTECVPDDNQRVIDPEVCYKLRCCYLHSGNLELNQRKNDNFPEFKLIISNTEDEGVYNGSINMDKSIMIDIRHLTKVLCNAAKEYYDKQASKEIFQSKHIQIVNLTDEVEKMKAFFSELIGICDRENALLDYGQLSEGAKQMLEEIRGGKFDINSLKRGDENLTKCSYELLKGGFVKYTV